MFKKSPILGALGTIAALAVLGSTVPVGTTPAHASTPCAVFLPSDPPPDAVRINRVNFDFGGNAGLDENNDAENCGTLTWDLANGTIKPRLTGTLYAKNSIGTTVRMSLRHRDVDGTPLGRTNTQPKEVLSDDVEEFPINLSGFNSPLIYQVDVELQQETSPDVWEVQGSQTVYIGSSTKAPESVRLLGAGEDFGGGNFTSGAPAGSGTLTWDLASNTIRPRLTGNLYVQNGLGSDFRMRMRHYDVHGNHLGGSVSGRKEPTSNTVQTFSINMSAFSNPEIYRTEVSIEVDVFGTWTPTDAQPLTFTI
jgi:hypothetical protein